MIVQFPVSIILDNKIQLTDQGFDYMLVIS